MTAGPARFCTTCQSHRPEAGGVKTPGSTRSWRCRECSVKATPSIYASKKTKEKLWPQQNAK